MTRFAVLSMLALVILGLGTVLVSEDIAESEARRDAQTRGVMLANGTVAPLVDSAVRERTPGAVATLALVMRNRIAEGSVRHVKLWARDGTVFWADSSSLIGRRFVLPPEIRALFGTRNSHVELSDLDHPENVAEAAEAPLLEVYVGTFDADGRPFVFETYTAPDSIAQDRVAVFRRLLPLGFGILLLFEAAVLTLSYFLARDVDRAQRHRDEIIARAVASWRLERRRLAQDLHDGVIQDLAAVSYSLPAVLEGMADGQGSASRETGERLVELLRGDLMALRTLVTDMYPADLSADGLRRAITDLFAQVPGVEVELALEDDLELEPEVAGLVYRLVRESLRNVARHAQASRAWVRIEGHGDLVSVTVSDDGRGFGDEPDPVVPHNGIKLFSELLADVGGSVRLEQRPGGGAVVLGQIPAEIGPGG